MELSRHKHLVQRMLSAVQNFTVTVLVILSHAIRLHIAFFKGLGQHGCGPLEQLLSYGSLNHIVPAYSED